MAIVCPKCGAQYDVTLFAFGRTVTCDCGQVVDALKPQQFKSLKPTPTFSSPDDNGRKPKRR